MMIDHIQTLAGTLTGVYLERITWNESFIELAARFADMPGTVILMSGGDMDCSRYHLLGAMPWLSLSGRFRQLTVTLDGNALQCQADPFDMLRSVCRQFHLRDFNASIPFGAGFMGYLSYDLKDVIENLPRTSVDDLRLPHICLFAPSIIVVHDKKTAETWLCIPQRKPHNVSSLDHDLAAFKTILSNNPPVDKPFTGDAAGFRSGFTRSGYMDAIRQIKDYIASGHVYQVNLSQRFETAFSGSAFTLFKTLYERNPAPFFAYIHAGNHWIVSTSPERFILRDRHRIETRPIKGTRPRGDSPEKDQQFKQELSQSQKDDAELSMIVDLLRNDIGKVCEAGTVKVSEHKRIEAYRNVWHLVSVVEGRLKSDRDSVDLLRAVFPGGSITGCPKIRSMEIIDELEPVRRHIYTGSIGYISFHDTMDWSIAIRTATIYNGKMIFSVGGGIVFDSDPSDEYDETLHKGKTLLEAFTQRTDLKEPQTKRIRSAQFLWLNGAIIPSEKASIPMNSFGFQYGYGCFETIRAVNGVPEYLDSHRARFDQTWEYLFHDEPPDLSWDEIIRQVLDKNNLNHQIAAVKIIAAKKDDQPDRSDYILAVTAKPYTHRLKDRTDAGLHLGSYPYPRVTPLADHKTLNYLYYYLAGQWAKSQGFDEALIFNPDNTLSETHTANLLLITDHTVTVPDSSHALPGIMQAEICRALSKAGFEIKKQPVRPESMFSSDLVMMTNSLIGAVPVISLDRKPLRTNFDFSLLPDGFRYDHRCLNH